jgi:hypothetical protein
MTDDPGRFGRPSSTETITIDGQYFRTQANVALKLFVAPLSGVYEAAFGPVSKPVEPTPERDPKDHTG